MPARFKIEGQTEVMAFGPDGRARAVWRVRFTSLPSGTEATVEVPIAEYTPARVGELVSAYVDTIEAVHALGQG